MTKKSIAIVLAVLVEIGLGLDTAAFAQPKPQPTNTAQRILTGWSQWNNLGGPTVSGPACASGAPGKLECVIGAVNSTLLRDAFDGNTWSNWFPLAPVLLATGARPNCVSWGANHVDCFVRSQVDNVLLRRTWDNGYDSGWEILNITLASDPSCVSIGSRLLDCFSRDASGRLQRISFDGNIWRVLPTIPAAIADGSTPSCIAFKEAGIHIKPLDRPSIECVATFTDATLKHLRVSIDTAWRPMPGGGIAKVPGLGPVTPICRSLFAEGRLECFATFTPTGAFANADLGWWVFNGSAWTLKTWKTDFGSAAQPNTGLRAYDFDCVLRTGGRTDCMEMIVRNATSGVPGGGPVQPSRFRHGLSGTWRDVGQVNAQAGASFISCISTDGGKNIDCVAGGSSLGVTPAWHTRSSELPQIGTPLGPR